MNLKFAKVQSVFPLEPISARVLCLHCHQMTNARTCENARRSPPTTQMVMRRNGELQLSSQIPWVFLLRPRVLRMPTLVTSGINPLSTRRRIASLVPLDTPLTASLSPCITSQIHFSLPKPPPIRLAFSFSFALPLMRIPWLILKKCHFHICVEMKWMWKKKKKQNIMEYSAFSDEDSAATKSLNGPEWTTTFIPSSSHLCISFPAHLSSFFTSALIKNNTFFCCYSL